MPFPATPRDPTPLSQSQTTRPTPRLKSVRRAKCTHACVGPFLPLSAFCLTDLAIPLRFPTWEWRLHFAAVLLATSVAIYQGELGMKKFAALFLSLILFISAAVPTQAQTRKKSKFGRKARTVAMIAGGAALGVLTGGLSVAALGAGGAGLYAFNRRAARRHFKPGTRKVGTILSGVALGAGVGGLAGGSRAAAIGAGVGGVGSYAYSQTRHARRRY